MRRVIALSFALSACTLGFQYSTGPGDGYRVFIDDVVLRAE